MLRVRRFLRQAKPDIVQVFPGSCHFPWLLPILMPGRMRFVVDIRQINLGVQKGLRGQVKEWQAAKAWWLLARFLYDYSCFNHEAAARWMLGERWPERAVVVPVGISPRFLGTRCAPPASSDPNHPVRFIYVGIVSRFRKFDVLLTAIRQVLCTTQEFQVLLVGPDDSQGHYQQMVSELDLNAVVTLRPPVPYDQVPELLCDHDVGLAYVPNRPTWHLQPTLKAVEYRAAGLPILSVDVAGHRELVEDGVNGLLVPDSVEGLAKGMLQFIQNRDFLERCRINASQMRQALTIDEVARMYEEVYEKLGQPNTARLSMIGKETRGVDAG
jgi:glycosyltransferase involved in cell wall biosynthesis